MPELIGEGTYNLIQIQGREGPKFQVRRSRCHCRSIGTSLNDLTHLNQFEPLNPPAHPNSLTSFRTIPLCIIRHAKYFYYIPLAFPAEARGSLRPSGCSHLHLGSSLMFIMFFLVIKELFT